MNGDMLMSSHIFPPFLNPTMGGYGGLGVEEA